MWMLSWFYLGKLKIYEIIWDATIYIYYIYIYIIYIYMRWFICFNDVSFNLLLFFQQDTIKKLVNPWTRSPTGLLGFEVGRLPSQDVLDSLIFYWHNIKIQRFLFERVSQLPLCIFCPKVRSWGIQYSGWRWVLEFYVPVTYLRIEKNIDTFTGRLSVCEEVTDLFEIWNLAISWHQTITKP